MNNVLYFAQCKSLNEVEETYKKIYEMFGLKSVPKDGFPRKAVDAEYRDIRKYFESVEKSKSPAKEEVVLDYVPKASENNPETNSKELTQNEILEKINPLNLDIEICGKWIWIRGNTSPYKDYLKELKLRYSPGKKSWYWRPNKYRSFNNQPIDMEEIRRIYGSEKNA